MAKATQQLKPTTRIHRFLEKNLPEYQRKHLVGVAAFYLSQVTPAGQPFPPTETVWKDDRTFEDFCFFITIEWQGAEGLGEKTLSAVLPKLKEKPVDHGVCSCGGRFVVRTNRAEKNKFLGCANYPKCRNTKNIPQ